MNIRPGQLAAFAIALAVPFGDAQAACLSPAPVNPAAVEAFKANPQALLSRFPEGGAALVAEVRNLATSDGSAVPALATLTRGASPAQAGSIGTALAQAAGLCVTREPATTQLIQTTILGTDNTTMILAFQAAAGDIRTAAVGAGGGGGGGGSLGGSGLGGSGLGSSGGSSFSRSSDTGTTPNTGLTFSTAAGIAPTLATRTAVTSVSP